MENTNQTDFMNNIRQALGHSGDDLERQKMFFNLPMSEKDRTILRDIENRTPQEKEILLETMIRAAEPINLNVIVLPDVASVSSAIVDLVREKLLLWGLTQSQIDEIEKRGTPSDHVTIYSPSERMLFVRMTGSDSLPR